MGEFNSKAGLVITRVHLNNNLQESFQVQKVGKGQYQYNQNRSEHLDKVNDHRDLANRSAFVCRSPNSTVEGVVLEEFQRVLQREAWIGCSLWIVDIVD
jgi:hypothetical protein